MSFQMKSAIVFFLFLFIGFFTLLLYGKWNQAQTVQKAKISADVTSEKIPFAVETAPAKSLRAEIVAMNGDVYWESRIATSPALLKEPMRLQQGESLETEEDASLKIVLPEFAEILVAENAKFSLIQTLPSQLVFGQNAGVIVYTNSATSAISVRSLELLLVQEKGRMTVAVSEDDQTVSITVTEGNVSVAFNDLENKVSNIVLVEGQRYLFDEYTRTGDVVE